MQGESQEDRTRCQDSFNDDVRGLGLEYGTTYRRPHVGIRDRRSDLYPRLHDRRAVLRHGQSFFVNGAEPLRIEVDRVVELNVRQENDRDASGHLARWSKVSFHGVNRWDGWIGESLQTGVEQGLVVLC